MGIPLCKCGCGKEVGWSKGRKRWNAFLHGHGGIYKKSQELKKQKRLAGKPLLCQCGCGCEVKWNKDKKCYCDYINHHNSKGRKHTKKTREKLRQANLGKKQSKETVEKRSKKLIGRIPWNKGIKNCFSEEALEKISNASKGRKLSDEHKKKVSLGRKAYHKNMTEEEKKEFRKRCSHKVSKETRKKMSEANKKRYSNPKEREKISKSVKELWQDKEYKNKQMESQIYKKEAQSKSAVKRIKENPRTAGGYGKDGYYFSKKNDKQIHYRSSYELVAYEMLEQMSKVKAYEVEPFSIQYEWKKSIHRTIPDILITYTDGSKELIEVKPESLLCYGNNKVKIEAMKDYADNNNMVFNVWTEKELNIGD